MKTFRLCFGSNDNISYFLVLVLVLVMVPVLDLLFLLLWALVENPQGVGWQNISLLVRRKKRPNFCACVPLFCNYIAGVCPGERQARCSVSWNKVIWNCSYCVKQTIQLNWQANTQLCTIQWPVIRTGILFHKSKCCVYLCFSHIFDSCAFMYRQYVCLYLCFCHISNSCVMLCIDNMYVIRPR